MARGSIHLRTWKDGKRKSYVVRYRDASGKAHHETVGPSKKEAERVLAERMSEINRGVYEELRQSTFGQFAERWLEEYAKPRLKPSTLDSYQRHFDLHLLPALGRFPLAAISTGRIEELVNELLASGLSPKSVNNALVPLKLSLKHAVRWGYLRANPAEPVRRVPVPHQEMEALTPEQVRRLLAAADEDSWLLLLIAVFTGLRRGEILALQWGDVDWRTKQLRVRRSLWKGQFVGPKTKRSIRTVDLAPQVLAALREARPDRTPDELHAQLVFSGANGRPLDPDNMVKRRFHPALERAELPRVRFHDLRHTYASLLIAAGEHPKYVQAQLGHASIQTTLDRYGHLLPGAYSHGGERLEKTVLGEDELPRP
jgi:integrase